MLSDKYWGKLVCHTGHAYSRTGLATLTYTLTRSFCVFNKILMLSRPGLYCHILFRPSIMFFPSLCFFRSCRRLDQSRSSPIKRRGFLGLATPSSVFRVPTDVRPSRLTAAFTRRSRYVLVNNPLST